MRLASTALTSIFQRMSSLMPHFGSTCDLKTLARMKIENLLLSATIAVPRMSMFSDQPHTAASLRKCHIVRKTCGISLSRVLGIKALDHKGMLLAMATDSSVTTRKMLPTM
ncbi:hypothetical protein M758_9G144600 [Ceratodon purpureus]|nr:hypothetical protein M758_9G144600 [Ceratodon purpureus]